MEAARVAEGLTVRAAMEILGLSRSTYYRKVRGMLTMRLIHAKLDRHSTLRFCVRWRSKRVEAGHVGRAYALAWGKIPAGSSARSRMSRYRVLKSQGLLQPQQIGRDLREQAERRRQMLKALGNLNELLQEILRTMSPRTVRRIGSVV